MTFLSVLRKEILEQWRTHRLLIVMAVLVVFGLASPLLAKVTPELLTAVPGMPPGLSEVIPTPTTADALTQYVKNMSQFGILLALLMSMGSVVQEKERSTAAMMLSRPVSRETFLLAKFVALVFVFSVSIFLAALGCWYYTWLLFEALPWVPFVILNMFILLVLLVYVALTLLCSTLARSQTISAALAFGALILLVIFGALPGVGDYLPGRLFSWGTGLVLGGSESAWPALWVSLGLILIALIGAWLVFQKQEI